MFQSVLQLLRDIGQKGTSVSRLFQNYSSTTFYAPLRIVCHQSSAGADLGSARFNPSGSDLHSNRYIPVSILLCAGVQVSVVSLYASVVLTEYISKAVLPLYVWFCSEFKSQCVTVQICGCTALLAICV